jgi:hypothetical protein
VLLAVKKKFVSLDLGKTMSRKHGRGSSTTAGCIAPILPQKTTSSMLDQRPLLLTFHGPL